MGQQADARTETLDRAQRQPACAGPRAGGGGHPRLRHIGLGAIAEELTARDMLTRRGGRWHKAR